MSRSHPLHIDDSAATVGRRVQDSPVPKTCPARRTFLAIFSHIYSERYGSTLVSDTDRIAVD